MPSRRQPPKDELRSYFVAPSAGQLSAETNPCDAPAGYDWVHVFGPHGEPATACTGKWLIYLKCAYTNSCWVKVKAATEAGLLGIGAKVSTHSHMEDDPAGSWADHVVCVYTADLRVREDVVRVARELKAADAVRKQPIHYKPDCTTHAGFFAGNAPGAIAVYSALPPDYDQLKVLQSNLNQALHLIES